MITLFEKFITVELNKDGLNSKKYFGELENPKTYNFKVNEMPLIFIDFVGDKPVDLIRKEYSFNLYISHISFSKNEKTRTSKHHAIYDLLKEIDNKLSMKSFANSEPIKIGKSKKIYDAVVKAGYLTVFTKELSVILNNQ